MILSSIAKIKARTVFSFMIYLTWCVGMIIEMTVKGPRVPEMLNVIVIAQMAHYFGNKSIKGLNAGPK